MSDRKIICEIQAYTEDDKHWVRMTWDGHEVGRWGPLPSQDDAMLYAQWAGKKAKEISKGTKQCGN